MLRRGTDATGTVRWLRFARKNEHGRYDSALSPDGCLALAREVKEYENAYLTQQISFLETVYDYFSVYDLWHDPQMHTHTIQRIGQGRPVNIKVFHAGDLEDRRIVQYQP